MTCKLRDMVLGCPWFLLKRFVLPGMILPSALLMIELVIGPMVPLDEDGSPFPYTVYNFCLALLGIGVLSVGLQLGRTRWNGSCSEATYFIILSSGPSQGKHRQLPSFGSAGGCVCSICSTAGEPFSTKSPLTGPS